MSSGREYKLIKPPANFRRLDREISEAARLFGLPNWFGGLTVVRSPDGYMVELSQISKLQEDFADYKSHPIVKSIYDSLEELELIEITPDYEAFKKLLEEKINKVKKPKIVFMLGAGASKSNPSNIPTINEMLGIIVSKLPPVENPMTDKIKEWASRGNINIEDIMTAGYISSHLVSDISIHRLVGEIIYRSPVEEEGIVRSRYREPELREIEYVFSFKDVVDRVFSTVSGIMMKADFNPVHSSLAEMIKNCIDVYDISILTTNYDVCMEKALRKEKLEPVYLGMEDKKGIPIVKIHGSLNWFYCEGCQDVIIYDIEELKKFDKMYPTTASCLKCNTITNLFMVPPIAYKYVMFPPIVEIWQHAMNILERADVIIVIGYSFSLSDDYILKMIVNGLKRKSSLLVFLNSSRVSVDNLEKRLISYHEKIDLALIEDAAISTPIVSKIITESRPTTVNSEV